jgi:hypothetical protein
VLRSSHALGGLAYCRSACGCGRGSRVLGRLQAAAGLADEPAACECRSPSACLRPDRRYGRCRYELWLCPSEQCRKGSRAFFAPWRWLRDELAGRGAKGRRETSLAPNSAERDELNARLSPRLEFELAPAPGKFAWRVMLQCHDGTEVLGAPRYSSEQAARLAASKVKTVSGSGVARGVRDDYLVRTAADSRWEVMYHLDDGTTVGTDCPCEIASRSGPSSSRTPTHTARRAR